LEIGDVITNNGIDCKVTQVENLHHHKRISISDDSGYHKYKISRNPNYYEMQTIDPIWLIISIENLKIVSKKSDKSIEERIKEKELELETLKKELKEVNRKKNISLIIPGNVYKFTWTHGGSYVRYVRESCDEKVYLVNLIHDGYSNMYTNEIDNVEYLPELTETYKKLKNLLESA
jgi:hypothetical protein